MSACERCAELTRELREVSDELRERVGDYQEMGARCAEAMAERDAARAEIERLRGIKPELPPRPPDGDGLPRYGIRWNGPKDPIAVPMADGYWTPWHLTDETVQQARREGAEAMQQAAAKVVEFALSSRQTDVAAARREGAEAMREAAQACRPMLRDITSRSTLAERIRALPLPGDKP